MNRLQIVLCWCSWTIGPGMAITTNEVTSCLSTHFMYKMKSATVVITRPDNTTVYCIGLFICIYKPTYMAFPRNINATCRHLLTSASCMKQDDFEHMRVHINNNVTDIHERGVESIIYHPNYNETTHASDVALVRMDEPEDFPDGVPPMMFFNPLPVLNMEIKSTNKKPRAKLNIGVFIYQYYNATKYRCMVYLNSNAYYQTDPVECQIENNPHKHFEKMYWYMTFCSKTRKASELIPQGALLVHCKMSDTNLLNLKAIGLFSYSLVTESEQVDILFVYRVVFPIDVHLQNHTRHKRVYDGSDIADGKFPYIVFLTTVFESKTKCIEVFCTGTLIHPRHVLTLLSCIKRENFNTDNVKILLFRPYERVGQNMTFNVIQKIHFHPTDITDGFDHDNIALLLMNGTFPEVTRYPKLTSLEPIPHGTKLSCTTVGFSLVGRNLSRPITETVKPVAYSVEVEFDIDKCVNKHDPTDRNVYLCRTGDGDGRSGGTLCELGDEGGPLLCDRPARRDRRDRDRDADADDELYMYGMANVVPAAADCVHGVADSRANVLYMYMYKYHLWAGVILSVYDEYENRDDGTSTTANEPPSPPPPTTTTTTTLPPQTLPPELSEYYDTDDYDRTAGKRAIRCDGRGDRFARFGGRENAAAAVSIDVLVVVASSLTAAAAAAV